MTFGIHEVIFFNMKPITEYKDYRNYMLAFYEERKASGFTWRDFAALAGFTSPIFLKYVCEGKKNLSPLAVERVANAMSLTGFELVYFRTMVKFDHAKSDEERAVIMDDLRAIAEANKTRIMDEDEFNYFSSWKNSVIREMAAAMQHATPQKLADACMQPITAEEVEKTLEFLTQTGLLKRGKNGSYKQTDVVVSSGTASYVPMAVRNMHKQMGTFALSTIEDVPQPERNFSGLTMGVAKEDYDRILGELAECRRRIISIVSARTKFDRVYRLNMQFFPLSKELNSDDGKNK